MMHGPSMRQVRRVRSHARFVVAAMERRESDGMTMEQVGAVLGISKQAVEQVERRAMGKLRASPLLAELMDTTATALTARELPTCACAQCGAEYRQVRSTHRHCSSACRISWFSTPVARRRAA